MAGQLPPALPSACQTLRATPARQILHPPSANLTGVAAEPSEKLLGQWEVSLIGSAAIVQVHMMHGRAPGRFTNSSGQGDEPLEIRTAGTHISAWSSLTEAVVVLLVARLSTLQTPGAPAVQFGFARAFNVPGKELSHLCRIRSTWCPVLHMK